VKDLYVALLHHPVVDRNRQIITSSVTNLDLHDIARSCKTFGVKKYFVVHPSPDEQALNARIVNHWSTGYGQKTHPTRMEALEVLKLATDFEEVVAEATQLSGGVKPFLIGTAAKRQAPRVLSLPQFFERLESAPVLLVFGTGYGLAPVWHERLDFFLAPICGPGTYNHLSVRSAVAIYLDRIAGLRD